MDFEQRERELIREFRVTDGERVLLWLVQIIVSLGVISLVAWAIVVLFKLV